MYASGASISSSNSYSAASLKPIIRKPTGLVRIEQAIIKDVLIDEEKDELFPKFNVDGLMRGDYKSRMEGYAVAITNGIMSSTMCESWRIWIRWMIPKVATCI